MIKAQELRIGNLVLDYGMVVPVNHLMLSRLVGIENEGKKCINLSPILITEDWLVKFGFVSDWTDGKTRKEYSIKGMYLFHYKSGKIESVQYESGQNLIKIKTVHQLQNLYYALTGEELTIKE